MNERLSRSDVYDEVFKYLNTDTLLFWDEESSPLREWQNDVWSEALSKFSQTLNLPQFQITDGLFQLQQDDQISKELYTFLESFSAYELAGKSFEAIAINFFIFSI